MLLEDKEFVLPADVVDYVYLLYNSCMVVVVVFTVKSPKQTAPQTLKKLACLCNAQLALEEELKEIAPIFCAKVYILTADHTKQNKNNPKM